MKTTNPPTRNSVNCSSMRRGFVLFTLAFCCFALSPAPKAFGVSPKPDGGYPGANTAEGDGALPSLSSGMHNTALGDHTLSSNTTGTENTATGNEALYSNTTGGGNTANGVQALYSNTTGLTNTANGDGALYSNTTGNFNTANGAAALGSNTTGNFNTASGVTALDRNTTGSGNTASGVGALYINTTGSVDIALGNHAGDLLTTGDNNIDIGNEGVAGEANTIRIGTSQTATYVAGISMASVGGNNLPVVVDNNGQLGTMSSSRRFKKEIKPMDQTSQAILALKPVTFHYKSDTKSTPQFGLIAEEVADVNPDLVVRDAKGEIYTVRYDAVNAMLLNEFLKEHRKMQEQEATITQLKSTVAQQQKGMEVLAATLKTQASQIQKVSAQVEFSKSAPQMAGD